MRINAKNVYFTKLENLNQVDVFLDLYVSLKLSQDEIDNLNRSIISSEIQAVISQLNRRLQMDSAKNSTRFSKKYF